MQDWKGNATSIFATHGASNHSTEDRAEHDYYATDPEAVQKLLDIEEFDFYVLEPCCGDGHISKVLEANDYDVESWDLVKRSYGHQVGTRDFLQWNPEVKNDRDIVTNPPYNKAMEFVTHALDISTDGVRVAIFLKLTFLEGAKRKDLFSKYPPGGDLCVPESCGLLEERCATGKTQQGGLLCMVHLGKGIPRDTASGVD